MKSSPWLLILLWCSLCFWEPCIAVDGALEIADPKALNSSLQSQNRQKRAIDRVSAQQKELSARFLVLEERFSELLALVETQGSERMLAANNIESEIAKNSQQVRELTDGFTEIEKEIDDSFRANRIGSVLILIALLFEVPGAILLGGSNLANEQPHVFSLSATPDLVKAWSFGYEKVWDRLSFYGLLASLFLIVGFLLQVGGVMLILSLHIWTSLLFIAIALVLCLSIVYFLLGQHPDQSRSEKVKVFWLNLKRLFPLTRTERCDYCSEKITKDQCQIWWVHGRELKNFHIGHRECLERSGWYHNLIEKEKLNKASPSDFFSRYLGALKELWEEKRAGCPNEKGRKPGGTQYEYEFNAVVARASKLLH